MRKLATLENQEELNILKGYLYYRGIEAFNYEEAEDLNLWVVKDSEQEKAKSVLLEFQKVYLKKESFERRKIFPIEIIKSRFSFFFCNRFSYFF